MSESEPRFIKLYDLFSGELFPSEDYNLVIPNYQRGYKWAVKESGKESSVEFLINSILESFRNKSELFLQGITVSDSSRTDDNKRRIIIIDGQQRITTLYLLLWYLDKEAVSNACLVYEARKDTDDCLNGLKSLTYNDSLEYGLGNNEIQDIFFIEKAISQIHLIIGDIAEQEQIELKKYIKEKIKAIYIPIIRKEDALNTFTMMNGSKAIMRREELIKSELLRMVSQAYQSFSVEDVSSMEDILIKLRDFSAMDWNTVETRSRYAREWDRWLYWWNRPEVKSFYRTKTENRPLGLLIEYFYRQNISKQSTSFDFKQFQADILSDKSKSLSTIAASVFKGLRKLQKQFEDAFNDNYIHNMLCMALSCGDRYETIIFFLAHLNDSQTNNIIRRFTEAVMTGASLADVKEYAENKVISEVLKERKLNFCNGLLAEVVYDANNEDAFRYLSYRNIIEANKLNERFNSDIFLDRSLEHIHPKSKVLHIDSKTGQVMTGANKPYDAISTSYPNPLPKDCICRDSIVNNDGEQLSEHSICNLVLLFGNNNSALSDHDFQKKKQIFFQVTDNEKIFISRTLQHTLSKFASPKWDVEDMMKYYEETKNFLKNEFLKDVKYEQGKA